MPVIAPWRVWEFKSRDDEIDYAESHNIPLRISRETNYSKDKNLWHLSHEGLDLEDPANEPQYAKILEMGVTPEQAPDAPEYVTIDFEKGVPVAVNGEKLDGVALIEKLNQLGGKHGVGILDMVEKPPRGHEEPRRVRDARRAPSSTSPTKCSSSSVWTRNTQHMKQKLALDFADLGPTTASGTRPCARRSPPSSTRRRKPSPGTVKVKLYKGNITGAGMTSPYYPLYDEEIATFGEDAVYDQADSAGFIALYGLPIAVQAMKKLKK